jgi:hypothetical protein
LNHLLKVFLIDKQRWVREIYSNQSLDPAAILGDIETLSLGAGKVDHHAMPGRLNPSPPPAPKRTGTQKCAACYLAERALDTHTPLPYRSGFVALRLRQRQGGVAQLARAEES